MSAIRRDAGYYGYIVGFIVENPLPKSLTGEINFGNNFQNKFPKRIYEIDFRNRFPESISEILPLTGEINFRNKLEINFEINFGKGFMKQISKTDFRNKFPKLISEIDFRNWFMKYI